MARRTRRAELAIVELAVDPSDVDAETYPVRIRLTRPLTPYEAEGLAMIEPTLRCEDEKCSADACISDGTECGDNAECCSGKCVDGACEALNPSCKTAGNECGSSGECCSKLCGEEGTCTLGDGTFDCVLPLLAYGETATIVSQTRVLSEAAGRSVLALDVTGEALLLPEPARTTGNLRVAAIDAAPSITAVTPARGSPDGYEQVTLTGDNFQVGATVYFGTVAAADAAVVDAHTIRATTLAQPAGVVSVRVVNPGGLESTLSQGFRFGDEPAPPPPPPPPGGGGSGGGGGGGGGGGSLTVAWDALLLALALAHLGRRRKSRRPKGAEQD